MRIHGSAVAVTGAGGGLGLATAREVAARGGVPLLVDLAAPPGDLPAGGTFRAADITDESAVTDAFAHVGGPLRAVVHCAGISGRADNENGCTFDVRSGRVAALSHIERVIRVNLVGTLNVVRLAAQLMADNEPVDGERGVIVCTSSIAAFDGHAGQSIYAAAKAGVAGMTLPLARELAGIGVRVVTIAPGMFDTPIIGALPDSFRRKAESQVPFPSRMGRPSEFGTLACDVIENGYLNGEVVRLDGGLRTN